MSASDHAELQKYFQRYARASFQAEPVYVAVCDAIVRNDAVLDILAAHPRPAQQPNLIMAAVRWLTDDTDHPLATSWSGPSVAETPERFCDFVVANRDDIDEILATRTTQTNETGRSSALALMLTEVHRRSGLPLGWIDLGTSAGLNLRLDHFRIDYTQEGELAGTGDPDAGLHTECEVFGEPPVIAPEVAPIAWRIGVDRTPIDPTIEAEARWLAACIWPNHHTRQARLKAALAVAADFPVEVIKADAVEGVRQALQAAPPGVALVMTTSWVWYYLPDDARRETLDVLRSSPRRVMWASLEGRGVVPDVEPMIAPPTGREDEASALGLLGFGGGEPDTAESLGWAHNHGSWIAWQRPA